MSSGLQNISPELISQAKFGDKDSIDRLTGQVREHLMLWPQLKAKKLVFFTLGLEI
jgi:hypothetical protein